MTVSVGGRGDPSFAEAASPTRVNGAGSTNAEIQQLGDSYVTADVGHFATPSPGLYTSGVTADVGHFAMPSPGLYTSGGTRWGSEGGEKGGMDAAEEIQKRIQELQSRLRSLDQSIGSKSSPPEQLLSADRQADDSSRVLDASLNSGGRRRVIYRMWGEIEEVIDASPARASPGASPPRLEYQSDSFRQRSGTALAAASLEETQSWGSSHNAEGTQSWGSSHNVEC